MSTNDEPRPPPPSGWADPLMGLVLQVGLPQEPANFVFSPVSIRLALSLIAAGAAGKTLDQMVAFLGTSPTSEGLQSSSARLVNSVLSNPGSGDPSDVQTDHSVPLSAKRRRRWGPSPRVSLASGVWVDQSLPLKPSFEDVAASIYRAQSKSVDFQTQPRAAADEVNAWVEKATNGLIRELVPHESIGPSTRLVLATALYFGVAWEEPFSHRRTRTADFHLLDGTSVQVPFMTIPERQYVAVHHGFKVLKLLYHRGVEEPPRRQFSMCLFLPDETCGLAGLAEKVAADPDFVHRHVPGSKVKVGKYGIPKFKISFQFEASDAMTRLGLELPFSPSEAELTEMVVLPPSASSAGEKLHVAKFFHRALVEVQEEGTEAAAAATGVVYRRCGHWDQPVDFVADHPFLFVIREEESREILFLGYVMDPSSRG